MTAAGMAPVTLHADQEHSGIRLTIFFALFVGYLIGFWIVSSLLNAFAPPAWADFSTFLSCIGGLPIALLFIWVLEKVLKRVWHSGLSLTLDEQGLFVNDSRSGAGANATASPAMVWSEHLNQLNWYFRLKGYPRGGRERRVAEKWYCLAMEVQQDEARLSVYSLMPPEKASHWTEHPNQEFRILNISELYENTIQTRIGPPSRPNLPHRLLQSKDGRFWLAERRRWEYGIELSPDDFATLMQYITEARQTKNNFSPS